MTLSKDEVHQIAQEIAREAVVSCRTEVDLEISKLREADQANAWTEDKAKKIAAEAAALAVKQITDSFYLSVGKKTVTTIGALVVGGALFLQDEIKRWVGIR